MRHERDIAIVSDTDILAALAKASPRGPVNRAFSKETGERLDRCKTQWECETLVRLSADVEPWQMNPYHPYVYVSFLTFSAGDEVWSEEMDVNKLEFLLLRSPRQVHQEMKSRFSRAYRSLAELVWKDWTRTVAECEDVQQVQRLVRRRAMLTEFKEPLDVFDEKTGELLFPANPDDRVAQLVYQEAGADKAWVYQVTIYAKERIVNDTQDAMCALLACRLDCARKSLAAHIWQALEDERKTA